MIELAADLPPDALSVRQPWAWAIIHAGKPVENRSRFAVDKGGMRAVVGKRIAIHASKGMTRYEYEGAALFMHGLGVAVPPAAELKRGGIIGSVECFGIARNEKEALDSPWFVGPWGLLLRRPSPASFVGAQGALGIFKWKPNEAEPEAVARWMMPRSPAFVLPPPITPKLL